MDYKRQLTIAIWSEVVGGLLMALASLVLGLTDLVPLGRVDHVLAIFLGAGAVACFLMVPWTYFVRPPGATRN